jgi:hypothetical protein
MCFDLHMATHDNDNETLPFITLRAATQNVLELLKQRQNQNAARHRSERQADHADGEDQRSQFAIR